MTDTSEGPSVADSSLEDLLRTPLDPALVDAARLRMVAALIGVPPGGSLSFTALRRLLGMTDGNLGMHLRVLTEIGYIAVTQVAQGRRRQSHYSATATGRAAFEAHVSALEGIITAARGEPDS